MKIRHTVIFTFYEKASNEQRQEVILRLNEMGNWLAENLGVTDWTVAEHMSETFKSGRAHLLQDGIFPSLDTLEQHAQSDVHKKAVKLTCQVSDWMTIDTMIDET